MKQGWQEIEFEKSIEKIEHTNKIPRKNFLKEGKYPIISQEESLINGYWNDQKDLFKSISPIIIFGDHTKILKYIDFDFVLGADGVKILKPINQIVPKYFYYFLLNIKLRTLGYARHYRLLREQNISYPIDISEQKRIVKILDKAFEDIEKIKENAKQNLQNSKSLFQSYLNKLFTENTKDWKEKKIEEVCDIISGTTPDTHNKLYWNGRNFWITPAEINEKFVYINNTERKITDLAVKECSLRKMPKGTIIFSSRAPIGKIAISNIDLYCNQGFKNFICSQDILNTFLYYFLLCKKQYIISLGKGTTFKEVSKKIVANIQINFPNISIQKQIVKKLDMLQEKTKKLEEIYNKKLQLTEELKQSILHKAFNGEL